ncbi:M1 family metallopeptidase [Streptomyces sp. AV19]|uniref:M1 family metallopeptidase n=1 Tax=Streptomyces sp. AV19 TaxID=2793068 RepID=UPI0018FE62D5|nr:M1 family metallopeptidase [Streptomyces sp. AV19]MBH1933408.1 M1 family metallopeptidase [Streptomyces sp. AV19]MDG4532039.1 M1 family metallopeptidase [Streptomyces sp. AV19]
MAKSESASVSTARRRLLRRAPVVALALALVAGCSGGGGSGPRAGGAGAGDPVFPSLGNGGYQVEHYGLELDYEPEGNDLDGTAVITARATEGLSSFTLDFKGMKVTDAKVGGKAAKTSRSGAKLKVVPEEPVSKGATFKTEIAYEGKPKTIRDPDGAKEGWVETAHGAVGLGEPQGSMAWFPGNHHPSDKATYDFTVSVPSGFTAVANGELKNKEEMEDEDGDDWTAFTWHSAEPMASYLASVAVGDFKAVETDAAGVPAYIAYAPKQADAARHMKELLPKAMAWARERFGPYPFASTGAVIDDNPDIEYALETQTKPYFPGPETDKIIVHELAHQWFGNSVTPRTWRDMWLNEGFAQYAEWMWEAQQEKGRSEKQTFDDYYDGKDSESKDDGSGDIWAFAPAYPKAETISGRPVYGRGAMVLHKVRETVGDSVFFGILRSWTRDHRHGNAGTDDFIELCEKKSGKDLGDLFDTWLFRAAKPDHR